MSNLTSGVFLVRISEKRGDYVLTMLFENQPKNFMIQKYVSVVSGPILQTCFKIQNYNSQHKFFYIDDGPYMERLEHLVQYYMNFSDGLPINLRHPVPPKPKPPLPLFSTIPKTHRIKSPVTSPVRDNGNTTLVLPEKRSPSGSTTNAMPDDDQLARQFAKKSTHRNLSIPTDYLMNQVGLLDKSSTNGNQKPSPDSEQRKSKDLIFRSLKLRSQKKNIIIDGMKSLRKTGKPKAAKKDESSKNIVPAPDMDGIPLAITQSLRNLSFSSDLYNVPTNNGAVITTMAEINSPAQEDVQNQNVALTTPKPHGQMPVQSPHQSTQTLASNLNDINRDYFTESDNIMAETLATEQGNKGVEEIYFVDAPTITKSDLPTTSFQYVAFQQVPFFPDATATMMAINSIENNNMTDDIDPQQQQAQQRAAIVSMVSMTDSEFMLQHQTSCDSTATNCPSPGIVAKPNYFIPKSHLQLNDVLGEGEFGSVYCGVVRYAKDGAVDGPLGELPVAIKTLHDEHCKQNRTEFLREASVMIKLAHHCIVKLIGISKVSL